MARVKSSRIKVNAADGHTVKSTAVRGGSNKLVLLSHGIVSNKDEDGDFSELAEKWLAPEFDSIRYDFRGHGQSTVKSKDVTISGEILDLMAVVGWARQQGYSELYHVAASFGASIALLAASRFNFGDFSRAVFWNPVTSYINTFVHAKVEWGRTYFDQESNDELAYRSGTRIPESKFVIGPRMTMEFLFYKPEDVVWPADLPLLIIHGDADTYVPHSDSAKYQERNSQSVILHTLQGVDHGFDDKIKEAMTLTSKWLRGDR
jgi:pimeloyl-ACP methyl ester carboxylesterase